MKNSAIALAAAASLIIIALLPLANALQVNASSGGGEAIKGIIGLLVPLALADSINPCTFTLYAVMLLSVSMSGSRSRVAAVGIAFIAAIILGYFSLGMGLSQAATYLPRWAILAVATAYSSYLIVKSIRGLRSGQPVVCREGDESCRGGRLGELFSKRVGVAASFAVGLIASFTLLPCSAGPYIVFAMLISSQSLLRRIALLLVYDVIFVLPLTAILAAMLGVTRFEGVRERLVKYQPIIGFISASLLIAVALTTTVTS